MPQFPARLRSFFGLKSLPFDSDLGPEDFFPTVQFEDALQRLRYMAERRGIATLTAPVGVGKSTLIRTFLHDLGHTQFFPAYVPETTCSVLETYKAIAYAFDIHPAFRKIDLLKQIRERLMALACHRKITPVLVLDEAHLLHRPFFDELRILLNFDADRSNPIMLLLSGQPQLQSSLRLSINEALRQRIICRIELSALDRQQSEDYIAHRLKLAGRTAPIFSPDAFEAIFTFSNGVTRSINRLLEASMLLAFKDKKKEIDLDIVNLAISELDP